jgi:hypothetical protein
VTRNPEAARLAGWDLDGIVFDNPLRSCLFRYQSRLASELDVVCLQPLCDFQFIRSLANYMEEVFGRAHLSDAGRQASGCSS